MPVRDIREVKCELRSRFKKYRLNMPDDKKIRMDREIVKKICSLNEYKNCGRIFTYVSKDIEVDTLFLIETALSQGKKVAVPRCVPDTRLMNFYYITSLKQLEKASFGVLEPITDVCKITNDFSEGLCIVPGLSFDTEGYRLGYGKGYYDRFLSGYKGVKVGICYNGCVLPKLPHGFYDKPVDILITEKFISNIKN